MASLDALAEDSEIVDLLATVFNHEYTQGATGGVAAGNQYDTAAAQPPAVAATSRKLCKEDGCMRKNVSKGFCIRHGGGKRCQVEHCDKGAKQNGVCWKHGASRECELDGCSNHSKARGLCWSHGGGKPCSTKDCSRTALQGGHCWAHGGGKRCKREGCQRPAFERNGNCCDLHCQDTGFRE